MPWEDTYPKDVSAGYVYDVVFFDLGYLLDISLPGLLSFNDA
jgi:hypothetical protein